MQTILIFAVFQFPDIFEGVNKSMGVLKSKKTAKAQKSYNNITCLPDNCSCDIPIPEM